MDSNRITSKGANSLFDALKGSSSPQVNSLDLRFNRLGDECMRSLGEYIENNKYLTSLRLSQNRITDNGIEILSNFIIKSESLQYLYVDRNVGITERSIPYLINILELSKSCQIEYDYTSITDDSDIITSMIIKNYKSDKKSVNSQYK